MMSWQVSSNIVFLGSIIIILQLQSNFRKRLLIAHRVLAVKKERADREKESGMMKERIDNERKEIQISVDKVISEQNFVQTTQKSF